LISRIAVKRKFTGVERWTPSPPEFVQPGKSPGFFSGEIVRFSEIEFSDGDLLSVERVRPE